MSYLSVTHRHRHCDLATVAVCCIWQDDVVMGTLTVRENLLFSANLRLPKSLQAAERRDIVDDTIEELGLTACADTKVSMHTFVQVSAAASI